MKYKKAVCERCGGTGCRKCRRFPDPWLDTEVAEDNVTAPREIDKSDQRARKAMWEDFFTRRCPTARDVINSAVGALVLRDAQIADLEARVRELTAECKLLQRTREDLRREITMLETHGQRP